MAYDPRNVPQVGDEYGNGVVARAVVTAEGLEITVRESLEGDDNPGGEDRPVSIPQRVHPSAFDYVVPDDDGEAEEADAKEHEEVERQRAEAIKNANKAPAKPVATPVKKGDASK
jgi:hypothetical protein